MFPFSLIVTFQPSPHHNFPERHRSTWRARDFTFHAAPLPMMPVRRTSPAPANCASQGCSGAWPRAAHPLWASCRCPPPMSSPSAPTEAAAAPLTRLLCGRGVPARGGFRGARRLLGGSRWGRRPGRAAWMHLRMRLPVRCGRRGARDAAAQATSGRPGTPATAVPRWRSRCGRGRAPAARRRR